MIVQTVEISCCSCKCTFWILKQHNDELIKTKESFYCPSGHKQSYTGKSHKQELGEAREEAKKYFKWHEESDEEVDKLRRSIKGYKGVIGRLKKSKNESQKRT